MRSALRQQQVHANEDYKLHQYKQIFVSVLKGVYLTPTLRLTQTMQWSMKFLSSYATYLTEIPKSNHLYWTGMV